MQEIQPGVWHWSTVHEKWGITIHSHFLPDLDGGVLIDPRVPAEGLEWFASHGKPAHAILTNRHHYRDGDRFREAFGTVDELNSLIGLVLSRRIGLRQRMTAQAETGALISAAILALVGFVNVPIIKFSVDWWNTLHQPASIVRLGGPSIDPSMLWPLLVMAVAFTLMFVLLHLIAMRAEILRRRVHAMQQMTVEHAALVEA